MFWLFSRIFKSSRGERVDRISRRWTSAHCRSFRRRLFPVNHLHWYWQPNTEKQRDKKRKKSEHITVDPVKNTRRILKRRPAFLRGQTKAGLVTFYDLCLGNRSGIYSFTKMKKTKLKMTPGARTGQSPTSRFQKKRVLAFWKLVVADIGHTGQPPS